jgi:squalene-hopene/tetraprenyl-beta-curcumene cyclase
MVDPHRLLAAYETCRLDLLAERNDQGCWTGELSASALSTATAISALAIDLSASERNLAADHPVKRLVERGLEWLVTQQNSDGGWGDTDRSYSNIATTMLCAAAIHLAGMAERYAKTLLRANRYCAVSGQAAGGKPTGASPEIKDGIPALRKRYGKDKTFVVPILTNCALAGLVDWKDVAPLPFELACVPQKWYRLVNMPVVSYAIPALVAIGQARHFHKPSRNPLMRGLCPAQLRRARKNAAQERRLPGSRAADELRRDESRLDWAPRAFRDAKRNSLSHRKRSPRWKLADRYELGDLGDDALP